MLKGIEAWCYIDVVFGLWLLKSANGLLIGSLTLFSLFCFCFDFPREVEPIVAFLPLAGPVGLMAVVARLLVCGAQLFDRHTGDNLVVGRFDFLFGCGLCFF